MIEPRIRPPADLEQEVLAPLKDEGFFESKAQALLFAACLGFYLDNEQRPKTYGEGIKREYFEEEARVIDLISIVALRRLDAIAEDSRKDAQDAFERYACGGLEAIRDACFSGKRPPLEGLLELMSGGKPKGAKGVLPKLI